jgi:hypothetical protein
LRREIAAVEQDQQMPAEKQQPQLLRLREELDRAEQMLLELELETLLAEN